jgi:hypothetical protein
MKVCWDNLEKIIYRPDLGNFQNIKHKTVFYIIEFCDVCGDEFLKQKRTADSNGNFCDRKCYYEDRRINKEKYSNRKDKSCVICGEDKKSNFYKSDRSYCKKCRKKLTKEYDKVYNYKRSKEENRKKYKKRRLYYCMSARVRQSLKNGKGREKWTDLVGYSVNKLKRHLENQFKENMDWNNYGSIWEIDYIKPIASFDINSYEDDDFKECWSLNNLRPLSCHKNRSRGSIFGNNRRNK